jgi:uncharacterized protein
MKRLTLTLMLLFVACAGARGQEATAAGQAAEEKRRDIGRLLKLNGSAEGSDAFMAQMMPSLRGIFETMFEGMPVKTRERAVQIMEEEMRRSLNSERMFGELVAIYDRHFTAEEIKGLIAFYESPVGKKFAAAQASIITDAAQLGDKFGDEVVQQIIKRYEEEGIAPPPPPPPPPAPKRNAPSRRRTP